MRFSQLLITFTILIVSCTNINNELKTDSDLNNEVLNHIKFLSSDEMEGRYPGSKGSIKSADYIAQNFEQAGLRPYNSEESFQKFEFKSGVSLSDDNNLIVNKKRFRVKKDYIPIQFSESGNFKGQIIFTGYGLKVNELNWNDYKHVNNINVNIYINLLNII